MHHLHLPLRLRCACTTLHSAASVGHAHWDTELMALPSAEQQEAFCTEHLNCAICACQCGPAVHMYPFRGVVANCGCIV